MIPLIQVRNGFKVHEKKPTGISSDEMWSPSIQMVLLAIQKKWTT